MDIYKIVKKLIGEIEPVGETNEDDRRCKNLEETCLLVEQLVRDIEKVSEYNNRVEFSMKKMGRIAEQFRNRLTADRI